MSQSENTVRELPALDLARPITEQKGRIVVIPARRTLLQLLQDAPFNVWDAGQFGEQRGVKERRFYESQFRTQLEKVPVELQANSVDRVLYRLDLTAAEPNEKLVADLAKAGCSLGRIEDALALYAEGVDFEPLRRKQVVVAGTIWKTDGIRGGYVDHGHNAHSVDEGQECCLAIAEQWMGREWEASVVLRQKVWPAKVSILVVRN